MRQEPQRTRIEVSGGIGVTADEAPSPADPGQASALAEAWGPLPDDYLAFLRRSDGVEGEVDSESGDGRWLALFCVDEVMASNADDYWREDAPGLVLIGSNGGGESFLIDRLANGGWEYVEVPTIDIGIASPGNGIERRFPSLTALMQDLRARG